jgi:UTP--glucose-1-phosphate uridylyltransferase
MPSLNSFSVALSIFLIPFGYSGATVKVTKAVLPVAGLGTRFLPASKAIPKEMITVVDKPVIQYVVEEALAAGITEIVLVTHSSKKAIEDHFDVNYELEAELERRGKNELLQVLRETAPPELKVTAVRQGKALGLGHAVYCARPIVGDAPFAVMLPDVLVERSGDAIDLQLMTERFAQNGQAQIMVEPMNVCTNMGWLIWAAPNCGRASMRR